MNFNCNSMDSTLVQIIKQYEDYKVQSQGEYSEDSLSGFVLFLNKQLEIKPVTDIENGFDGWKQFSRQTLAEMAVSSIGKMGRYVENYSRKAMPQTLVPTVDEFTYLIVLLQLGSLTKTELIQHNAHPITSGTEVIKRLLKKEFIEQFDDDKDKRSVRVKLTEKGRVAIFSTAEITKHIASLATGILSDEELLFLVNTLKKLDVFHDKVYREGKNKDITELVKIFLT